jgi:excinuclease UvrABC nuclease subunit
MSVGAWSPPYAPYNEASVKKFASANSGIYCIWAKLQGINRSCVYVGKADVIRDRLLDHLQDNESNPRIKSIIEFPCGFCWLEVSTEAERSGIEKYLYDYYRPICNLVDPGGKPLVVLLPQYPVL